MLDDVLELAHVSREIVAHQDSQHFLGDTRNVLALEVTERRDEVIDQEGNVFHAIVKRGTSMVMTLIR